MKVEIWQDEETATIQFKGEISRFDIYKAGLSDLEEKFLNSSPKTPADILLGLEAIFRRTQEAIHDHRK